jgi:hypothetical protein
MQISDLSATVDSLKAINDELKDRLKVTVSYPVNVFQKFEENYLALDARMTKRESELHDFSSYFDSFRRSSDPTFVEVDAAQVRRMDSDPILASLLVSNEQRSFFSNGDLAKWNSELHSLITRQKDSLRELNGRLRIFEQYLNENWARHTVESLKNGSLPGPVAIFAPTRLTELEGKRHLMQAELMRLIKVREDLLKPEVMEKQRARTRRNQYHKAILIQKVFRGFLARRKFAQMKRAGLSITSAARGFLVRLHRKQLRRRVQVLTGLDLGVTVPGPPPENNA